MRSSALVAATIMLVGFPSCVAHAAAPVSGLRGTVALAAPLCPDDGCTKPAAKYTIVFTRAGITSVRVVTDSAGRYRVLLAPGTYAVSTARLLPAARVIPATIRVRPARVMVVDLLVDDRRQ